MSSLDEVAANTDNQLSAVLKSAIETISSEQKITFRLYVKMILPLDGFVYWINAAIVNPEELERMGQGDAPLVRTIKGSLHRQVVTEQQNTTLRDVNNIIFTTVETINDFNFQETNSLYLAEYDGALFSFSRIESQYTQSGIFHYRGTAILPTMRSQIIDDPGDIHDDQILSNSIPVWLSLKNFATIYPSLLIPQNLKPPYIVADVCNTLPLQVAPVMQSGKRYQLVEDKVRLTLYGFSNKHALDFLDFVVGMALDEEQFGITNIPIISDRKINQIELNTLAKEKTINFNVNYYQQTTRDISRQLIKKVIFNYEVK